MLGGLSAPGDIIKRVPRPADSLAFREILARFVDTYVESDPAVLGVRMLQDDDGPHLSVAVLEDTPTLPQAFEGIPVRAHLREPSRAAVGPLR